VIFVVEFTFKMDIVIATLNQNKLKEFRALLKGFPVTILSLKDFPDIPAIVEDGESFYENALKKATTVARYTKKLTIADDSGIEVEALGGRPGVYSSRFAGEGATDEENNSKLLKELKGVSPDKRGACFKCVLVVAKSEGEKDFVEGECRGVIIDELRGGYGFGYDPLFLVPEYNKTFSEIEPEEKNKISHRARALKKLLEILPRYL
jgi:XTP/dITP diphosphohydrolase